MATRMFTGGPDRVVSAMSRRDQRAWRTLSAVTAAAMSLIMFALVAGTLLLAAGSALAWGFPNQQIADKANSYADGSVGGTCKNFATGLVVDQVLRANGLPALRGYGAPGGCYYGAYANGGGVLVDISRAAPGDVIQAIPKGYTNSDYPPVNGLHTAIVVGVISPGNYKVRDSNFVAYNRVYTHDWRPSDWGARSDIFVWRFGSVAGPAQPLNPGCTSGTSTALNMIWTDASTNEDDFVVQYRVGTGAWSSKVRVAGANGTSGTVSGLAPGTTYTLQVGARNSAGTKWSVYFYGVTKPAAAAPRYTVVIDDPSAAFYGPPYWNIGYVGYGGSVHWTKNAVSTVENYAIWRPNLAGGNYEVQVHIPSNYANTRNAVYQIYTGYGWVSRSVNQEPYSNVWISLGTYNFTAGTGAYVQLNDATGEPYLSRMIGFDAVQFIPR